VCAAGSLPGDRVNPSAVAAMAEVGIDITGEFPKPWTDEIVRGFADPRVKLLRTDRVGKSLAQNRAIAETRGRGLPIMRAVASGVEIQTRADSTKISLFFARPPAT